MPSRPWLYNKLTEVLRFSARKLCIVGHQATTPRAYLGLPEIGQLIDEDSETAADMAWSEQHHLAWCMGRICALRPGSICAETKTALRDPQNPHDHVIWRDVRIFRSRYVALRVPTRLRQLI